MRRIYIAVMVAGVWACSDGAQPALDHSLGEDLASDDGPADIEVPDTDSKFDTPVNGDTWSAAEQIRVATFNCRCLLDSPEVRAQGIAAEIIRLDPHVVGLQEVCESMGSGGSDNFAATIIAELKARSGQDWEHRFAKTHVSWSVYDEGIGLLAPKGTLLASGEQGLPQGQGPFPRKVIWAEVSPGHGVGAFFFYNTHLSISSEPNDRASQVQAILALVNQHSAAELQVVVGDFNDWYASPAVSAMKAGPPAFTDAWGTKHPGSDNPGLTCCSPGFESRIDYIFVDSTSFKSLDRVELAFTASHGGVSLSDHRGVFAELTVSP